MEKELNHPPINFGKTGALIINLGTPDSQVGLILENI